MAALDDGTCVVSAASSPFLFYGLLILALPTAIWLVAYWIPEIYMLLRPVPNLKKKYQAEWALVTGAGSGIGKSLAFKLASQDLNVVLVSLDDDVLKQTTQELQKAYPKLQFRAVGCSFAPGVDYLTIIQNATKDIQIPIIFNNAGYIVLGFADQTPVAKLLANVECNATASLSVAHHFIQRMVQTKTKGCVVFTSSLAGFIPTPFAATYSATKSFCSALASSFHIEVKALGIDVCAVHPSPVATSFYDKVEHRIDMMEQAQKGAVKPDTLPDHIFKSIGACAWRDLGGMAVGTRVGTFFLPFNFFTELFAFAAPYLPDYKKHNKNRQ